MARKQDGSTDGLKLSFDPALARPKKRSLTIAGHRTSITLEDAFWRELKDAASEMGLSVTALAASLDKARGPAGLSAAIRARDGLARLSRERVRAELMKLLAARRAGDVVQIMGECGLLEPVLGGLAYPGRLSRLIAIEADHGRGPDPVLRLAALAVSIPEDAER